MNYDVPYVAGKIESHLNHLFQTQSETEWAFSQIRGYVTALEDVDRTPDWVVIAAVGYLAHKGVARFRVWKRDQTDVMTVKVVFMGTKAPT